MSACPQGPVPEKPRKSPGPVRPEAQKETQAKRGTQAFPGVFRQAKIRAVKAKRDRSGWPRRSAGPPNVG